MQPPEKPPAVQPATKRWPWFFGCLLIAATFLAYLPALRGGFVWDDDSWTTGISGLLQDFSGLRSIWLQPTALQQYYPLSGTTFWLDYQLWGFWTTPYHVENVLLHALAALLFWRLLLRLQLPGAWLAAALFALHPVMVESAAWITERKNVLSLALYLAALLAYLRYAQGVSSVRCQVSRTDSILSRFTFHVSRFYGLALVLFLGALLAKTTAFSLPAVILLLAWWQRGGLRWRADVLPTLPFFALSIGICLVTAWLEKTHVGAQGPDFDLTFGQRGLVAGRVPWFYLGQLLWPANLCFIYPRWQPDPGVWWQWLFPVTAVGALIALWLGRGRIGRGPLTAALFFVGTLFPLLGFLNAYGMRYSFVWDHWVYLPSLGIIALAAAGVARAGARLRAPVLVYGFAVVVLPVLGILTWRQAGSYRDMETLWRTTVARNPNSWMTLSNLGDCFYNRSQLEEAMGYYRKAVQTNPNAYEALSNVGLVLAAEGRWDEAIASYRQALQVCPVFYKALNNLGLAFAAQGRWDEAIEQYRKAIQINPGFYKALNDLGLALAAQGRLEEAIGNFQKAIQADPNHAETFVGLGMALAQSGRTREAAAQYRAALKLNPDLAGALNNLAWILAASPEAELRDGAEAVRLAERACELTHDAEPLCVGTLAAAYAEAGRFPKAVATAEKAAQLADRAGLNDLASKNRQLLELYRAGKAYHESLSPKP